VLILTRGYVDRICFAEHRESIALRCPATRKPGVAVLGNPSNACVRPLEVAGETSLFRSVRKTSIDSLETRATLSDARHCRSRATICEQPGPMKESIVDADSDS
jgi:hypothetical protein